MVSNMGGFKRMRALETRPRGRGHGTQRGTRRDRCWQITGTMPRGSLVRSESSNFIAIWAELAIGVTRRGGKLFRLRRVCGCYRQYCMCLLCDGDTEAGEKI